jgi:hypothetical protein
MRVLALVMLLWSGAVLADLPLSVEDLLTARHRYRFESNLEYLNRESSDLASGYLESNDVTIASLGLRYGVTLGTEVFGKAYGYHARTRLLSVERKNSDASSGFSRFVVGGNHQFSPDAATPALLGFFAVDLVEKPVFSDRGTLYGSGGYLGLTTYRSLDPLLLSAVLRYDYRAPRQFQNETYDPGDNLSLSPQVAFAVNHRATLTGGLRWEWQQAGDRRHGPAAIDRTRTSLLLGLGYSWSEALTVSLNGQFAVTDQGGSRLGLTVVYRFDDTSVLNVESD